MQARNAAPPGQGPYGSTAEQMSKSPVSSASIGRQPPGIGGSSSGYSGSASSATGSPARPAEDRRFSQMSGKSFYERNLHRKCQVCDTIARTRCPYQMCKNCCAQARNPCSVHAKHLQSAPGALDQYTLLPNGYNSSLITLSDARQSIGSLPRGYQGPWTESSGAVSKAPDNIPMGTTTDAHGSTSGGPPTPDVLQLRLRSLQAVVRACQQEAAAMHAWRLRKLREEEEAEQEAQNVALDRYQRNAKMCAEIFGGNAECLPGMEPDGMLSRLVEGYLKPPSAQPASSSLQQPTRGNQPLTETSELRGEGDGPAGCSSMEEAERWSVNGFLCRHWAGRKDAPNLTLSEICERKPEISAEKPDPAVRLKGAHVRRRFEDSEEEKEIGSQRTAKSARVIVQL